MTTGDAELSVLLRDAAAAPVHYPPGLVNRSLAGVRAARAGQAEAPFELRQDGGLLRVSAPAVTALVKRLGTEFCATLGGLRLHDVHTTAEEIVVTVAIGYGTPADRADLLRAALAESLVPQVGPAAPPITVHLGDVYAGDMHADG